MPNNYPYDDHLLNKSNAGTMIDLIDRRIEEKSDGVLVFKCATYGCTTNIVIDSIGSRTYPAGTTPASIRKTWESMGKVMLVLVDSDGVCEYCTPSFAVIVPASGDIYVELRFEMARVSNAQFDFRITQAEWESGEWIDG